jgi:nitrous oxidase accessory protein NosD
MRKGLAIGLAVVMILMGVTIVSEDVSAAGNTLYVDDDYTSKTLGWGVTHFATIQAAVSAASNGDTILVDDGTYYEHVLVNKQLTIKAAPGASPVVDGGGTGFGGCFNIVSSDVVIDGFEIQNGPQGVWIYGDPSPYTDITVSNNDIHDHTWNGIYVTHATVSYMTISGNTVCDNDFGIAFANNAQMTYLDIVGNEIHDNNAGLGFIHGTFTSVDVSECTFEGNAWEDLDLGLWGNSASFSDVSIYDNDFILPSGWAHIYVDSIASFAPGAITINWNNFVSTGVWGLCNLNSVTVNGEFNWWNSASGPGPSVGTGAYITTTVDYSPWLGYSTGTTPMTFHVNNNDIQDAVNEATAGDTILVHPGMYTSRQYTFKPPHWGPHDQYAPPLIVYKQDLTIRALDPNPANTIIQTTHNVWSNKVAIQASTGGTWDGSKYVGAGVNPIGGTAPHAVIITASGVTLEGFTTISTYGGDIANPTHPNTAGVHIGGLFLGDANTVPVFDTTIKDCVLRGYVGLQMWKAPDTTVEGCVIDNNIPAASPAIPAQSPVNCWEGWNQGLPVTSTNLHMIDNQIDDYKNQPAIAIGGYQSGPVDFSDLYLHGNMITSGHSGIQMWNTASWDVEISDNTMLGGILLLGATYDSTIEDNVLMPINSGPWHHGIDGHNLDNVLISNNDIQNNLDGWAMAIYDSSDVHILDNNICYNAYGIAVINSKGVEVHYNDIVGNGFGISPWGPYPSLFNSLGTGDPAQYIVDATSNWWGHASGPLHPTSWTYNGAPYGPSFGSGDQVSDYVLYDPHVIDIDIKPGTYPNDINLQSNGKVPVAILTTSTFDAATVDPDTILFAGASPVKYSYKDVDDDADLDLMLHFNTQDLDLDDESTMAVLTAQTYSAQPLWATDSVNIVP